MDEYVLRFVESRIHSSSRAIDRSEAEVKFVPEEIFYRGISNV